MNLKTGLEHLKKETEESDKYSKSKASNMERQLNDMKKEVDQFKFLHK